MSSSSYVRVRSVDVRVIRRYATLDNADQLFDLDLFLAKVGCGPAYALAQALYDLPAEPDAAVQAAVARHCMYGEGAVHVLDRTERIMHDLKIDQEVAAYARMWLQGAIAGGP